MTNQNQRSQLYAQINIEEQANQQIIELAHKMKSMKLKREGEETFSINRQSKILYKLYIKLT